MTKTLRKDSLIKSLGTAQYTDDIDIGEFLYGQIVGVPVSKGRLTKIIFDPEYDWNKFVICTASDLERTSSKKLPHTFRLSLNPKLPQSE